MFLISTNWPVQIFVNQLLWEGGRGRRQAQPWPPIGAKMWWALGRFEVFAAGHGMVPTVPGMGTDRGSAHDTDEAVPSAGTDRESAHDKD